MNKLQTAKKMSIIPVVATIISSLTFKYVKDSGITAEMYTGALIAIGIMVKDVLKYQVKLF